MVNDYLQTRFVGREDWGAMPPRSRPTPHTPTRIVLHHSWAPTAAQYHGEATIRAIQRYHMDTQRWADIGYHFLIAPDGDKVFAGRAAYTIGAHCGGSPPKGAVRIFGNTGSLGVCLIGNYDVETPAPGMLRALAELLAWLRGAHNIGPDRIFGHFEAWSVPPKTCPGRFVAEAMGWLDRFRRAFPENK